MLNFKSTLLYFSILFFVSAKAQNADDINGVWLTGKAYGHLKMKVLVDNNTVKLFGSRLQSIPQ